VRRCPAAGAKISSGTYVCTAVEASALNLTLGTRAEVGSGWQGGPFAPVPVNGGLYTLNAGDAESPARNERIKLTISERAAPLGFTDGHSMPPNSII
jgi:hypothetical protein